MHNEIQEVLGTSYGVPDEIDEDDLMGELDALELDMAQETEQAAASGIPSYLQVSAALIETPARRVRQQSIRCLSSAMGPHDDDRRVCALGCWGSLALFISGSTSPLVLGKTLHYVPWVLRAFKAASLMLSLIIVVQEVDLPELPTSQLPVAEGGYDSYGSMPAVPQRS